MAMQAAPQYPSIAPNPAVDGRPSSKGLLHRQTCLGILLADEVNLQRAWVLVPSSGLAFILGGRLEPCWNPGSGSAELH